MTQAATKLLDRGVCYADYLIYGDRALLAIDSRGNCIRRIRLSPSVDEGCARAWLEGLLDHYDPLPRAPELRIVPRDLTSHPLRFYIPRRPHR